MSSYSYHDKLIIAHAVFASIAVLILIPSALIIARYLRGNPIWFKAHSVLNATATVFIIIVFSLGTAAVASAGNGPEFTGESSDTHHQLGLAIFILILVQAIFGYVAHKSRGSSSQNVDSIQQHPSILQSRSPLRYLHILSGIVLAGLLYWQVDNGFDEWNATSDAGTNTPKSVRILYWILLALALVAYVVGWGKEVSYAKDYKRMNGGLREKNGFEMADSPESTGMNSRFETADRSGENSPVISQGETGNYRV